MSISMKTLFRYLAGPSRRALRDELSQLSDKCTRLKRANHGLERELCAAHNAMTACDVSDALEEVTAQIKGLYGSQSAVRFDHCVFDDTWKQSESRVLAARPQRLFKPVAIVMWGDVDSYMVSEIRVGQKVLGCSHPAPISPRAITAITLLTDMPAAEVGNMIAVHVETPNTDAVVGGAVIGLVADE